MSLFQTWKTRLSHMMVALCLCLLLQTPAHADMDVVDLNYIGSVELAPDRGTLTASWTVQIMDASRDSITFGLNRRLGQAVVTGDDMVGLDIALDPDDPMIRHHHVRLKPASTDRARIVRIAYSGALFDAGQGFWINSLDRQKVELTADSIWFPFDMRFDSRITANLGVRLVPPSDGIAPDWVAIGIDEIKSVGPSFHIRQREPALDIAFALLSQSQTLSMENYTIYDARTEPGTKISALNAALTSCTTYLNDLSGPAGPLPPASILVTDRSEGAYARGTLIALTDIENDADVDLQKFICHELAHYWSYANAGGPENWLNEGLADYIALMAIRATAGDVEFNQFLTDYRDRLAGYDLPPIWTESATERPSYMISYRAAPLALHALETRMGQPAFRALMQAVMVDRIPDTLAFLALVERLSDAATRDWFAAMLAEQPFSYARTG